MKELHDTLSDVHALLEVNLPHWYTRGLHNKIVKALATYQPEYIEHDETISDKWQITTIDGALRVSYISDEFVTGKQPPVIDLLPLDIAPVGFQSKKDDKLATKFREAADKMQKTIDDKFRDREENTDRKRRMAESARSDGRMLQKIQNALRILADRWSAGTVPPLLQGCTTKAHIDQLFTYRYSPTTPGNKHFDAREWNRMDKAGIATPNRYAAARELLFAISDPKQFEPKPQEVELRELQNRVLNYEIPGFFPTPPAVINDMLAAAQLHDGLTILEPSAGMGDIADAIREACKPSFIHVGEWNHDLGKILKLKGYPLVTTDFLEFDGGPYKRIIQNPPFGKHPTIEGDMVEIDHIRKAYALLAEGGRLISLSSPAPLQRNQKKAEEFRAWLDDVGAEIRELPDGAFKKAKRSTGVKVFMIIIDK